MQTDPGGDSGSVLDLLADPYARKILTAANGEPMTAKALSRACDASLPTIYRRVSTLDEHALLEEETVVDPDDTREASAGRQSNRSGRPSRATNCRSSSSLR